MAAAAMIGAAPLSGRAGTSFQKTATSALCGVPRSSIAAGAAGNARISISTHAYRTPNVGVPEAIKAATLLGLGPVAQKPRARAPPPALRATIGSRGAESSGSWAQAAKMAAYVFGWYAFNIVFNILNKSALNVFPAPWFIATLQLVASALFMVGLWVTGLHPVPRVSWPMIRALLPVALFHTIGHVSACVSFSQMAVSFAHVVKSAEPVLSVALSQALLGEFNPWYVWLSLLPIIAGCSLAAMKEVSFAWNGFNNAMISNLGMVLRNVYSKKSLGDYKNSLDGINLFALLSILSLVYLIPAALFMEGFQGGVFVWKDMYAAASATYGHAQLVKLLALSGVFYHLYNQASYMVLGAGISPVTFSVGNTMKRVAVVASSILFFKNPVSALNWIGSLVAMLGTGLYSAAKQKATNDAAKDKLR